jgi:hypothetical protein
MADYYDETSFIVPAATPEQFEFLAALTPGGTWEKEDAGYWFWSTNTTSDLEGILDDLVEYYQRFFPEGTLEIHIANYCSKPRVDEFGGSCIVVTADGWSDGGVMDAVLAARRRIDHEKPVWVKEGQVCLVGGRESIDLLLETLRADARSANFDPGLRQQIQNALEQLEVIQS